MKGFIRFLTATLLYMLLAALAYRTRGYVAFGGEAFLYAVYLYWEGCRLIKKKLKLEEENEN